MPGIAPVRLAGLAALACGVCLMPILSCSGKRPSNLGLPGGRLAPCPASPNCVSSDATDSAHHVEPFALVGNTDAAWRAVREEVARLPRTTIVDEGPGYLHAECASALFGFVDDLELALRAPEGLVAVRSASRLGYSDLGVNRRRVEDLRRALRARGVVH